MAAKQFGRVQRVAALLPLALLSTAATASIAGVGVTQVVAESGPEQQQLPDGASVPEQAIEAPASVSSSDGLGLGVPGDARHVVQTSSTNGIPDAALAAYQRAESVINSADKSCNLTWQLVAAIGRVESNHGRYGGNTLDGDGVAQPGIFGIPLDGRRNTAVIRDTDAGQYDDDTVYDRAVGPMQFIPGTWSVVGVDADGDGQRDPQDIDDSSLATAVYLCSGNDDLSTVAGQRAAVYRYNHSQAYVDLVLSIMNEYLDGDFTSVPDGTTAAGIIVPEDDSTGTTGTTGGNGGSGGNDGPRGSNGGNFGGGNGGGSDGPGTDPGTGNPGTGNPGPGTGNPGTGNPGTGNPGTGNPGTGNPGTGNPGGGGIQLPQLPNTNIPPVDQLLTTTQAILQCTLDGRGPLHPQHQQCIRDYTTP